jgi:hypothetical protein
MKRRSIVISGLLIVCIIILAGCTSQGNKTLLNGDVTLTFTCQNAYDDGSTVSMVFHKTGTYLVYVRFGNGYVIEKNLTVSSIPDNFIAECNDNTGALVIINGDTCSFSGC